MSMGKAAAVKLARAETLTFGQLREKITAARLGKLRAATVNRGIPLSVACDIYARAIAQRPDDEVPKMSRSDPYSRTGKMVPTRDFLIVVNILRDCGP